jgi:hypothetical protein
MKKNIIFVLLLSIFFISCSTSSYTVNISQNELQEHIDKKFPIEQHIMFGKLSLANPKIKLDDINHRVIVGFDFKYKMPFFPQQSAFMEASGILTYDKTKSAFFLHKPKMENITYLDSSLKSVVPTSISNMMNDFISEFFIKQEIYKIKDDSLKSKLYKKTLQKIEINNGNLQLILGLSD